MSLYDVKCLIFNKIDKCGYRYAIQLSIGLNFYKYAGSHSFYVLTNTHRRTLGDISLFLIFNKVQKGMETNSNSSITEFEFNMESENSTGL